MAKPFGLTKYAPLGLNIISISLDDTKQNWIQALNAEKPQWLHLRDKKGSQGIINSLYNIVSGNGIPYLLAIGSDKKYLAIGVDMDEIEYLIEVQLTANQISSK